MPLITWNDSYSVKIKQMDEQHRKLVDLINELHDAMKVGRGRQQLGSILDSLIEYTRTHFIKEELLMKANGYPGYEAQQKAHKDLLAKVVDIRSRHAAADTKLSLDVMSFLKEWLVEHIQKMDGGYGTYLNQKGIT